MIGFAEVFILLFIVLVIVLLPLIALIDILRNEFDGNNKTVWVVVVIFLPFLGSLLYFIIGTSQKIRKE